VQASDSLPFARELSDTLEVSNMLDVAEAVVQSALYRTESRGHHFRTDYPEVREEWLKHTVIQERANGELTLDTAPVIRLSEREGVAAR
jgi:succinate dehydrogenase/fumarate reductase flavoprotein subunit